MVKEMYAIKRSATGLGMFAQQIIPKHMPIVEYKGTLITNKQADKSDSRYIIRLNKTHSLEGKSRINKARYINHSCVPNAKAYTNGKEVWILAIKTIKPGEEITMDYGKEYFDEFIKPVGCKCKKCARK